MTSDEAAAWLGTRYDRDTLDRLRTFVDLVRDENDRQNLIAASTVADIWARHVVDSAQLLQLVKDWSHWIDIGTGAGFPGMIVALLSGQTVTMIEPRRLRAGFLRQCIDTLGLNHASVVCARAETADVSRADVVSARAVSNLRHLLSISTRFAGRSTVFLFPKGAQAETEMAEARQSWYGQFHVERSVIDPTSGIIVATAVRPR